MAEIGHPGVDSTGFWAGRTPRITRDPLGKFSGFGGDRGGVRSGGGGPARRSSSAWAATTARGPIDLGFGVGKHARDKGELLTGSERSIATRQGLLHGPVAQLSYGEVNWVQQKKGKSGERAQRDHYPRMMLLPAVDVSVRRHRGGIVAAQAEVGGPPLQQFAVCSGRVRRLHLGDTPGLWADLLR